MNDLHQPPKKSARPNLFAPKEATRIMDERISVLASLDANPPPKKKKKRGLAGSTLAILGVTVVLFAGVIYAVLNQPEQTAHEAPVASPTLPLTPAAEPSAAESHSTTSEAPSLPLSALAPDARGNDSSAPVSAVIENDETAALRDPVAILESTNNPHATTHTAPARKVSADPPMHMHDKLPPKDNATHAQSAPVSISKSANRATRTKPVTTARTAAPKAAPIDNDIVLLEGLLASSNRQEAKDRAAGKIKDKPQELTATEPGHDGAPAKAPQ